MKKYLLLSAMGLLAFAGSSEPTTAQTPTVRVPLCLQIRSNVKYYVPCEGVVPVDTVTGNALNWTDLFKSITQTITVSQQDADTGKPSTKAKPVQNADGTKLATETTLGIAATKLTETSAKLSTLITNLGTPLQAGAAVGGGGSGGTGGPVTQSGAWTVGLTGTLPAFAAVPTVNIGTIPTHSVNNLAAVSTAAPTYINGTNASLSLTTSGALRVDTGASNADVTANIGTTGGLSLNTTTATLFKAGQSIGNTSFGARLQDATGTPLGTIANPVYVSGGGGGSGGGTPTSVAGTPNVNVVTVQGIAGGIPQVMTGTGVLSVQNTAATPAGSNVIGSVANTAFGISGTLPAFTTAPTVNLGGLNGAATAARQDALVTALGSPLQAGGSVSLVGNLGTLAAPLIIGCTDTSNARIGCASSGGAGGSGDASAANQTVVQATSGTDATKATAVQGITGGKAIAVTGTFFPASQAVTVASLPLPTGAATAAGLTTLNTTLGSPFQQGGSIGNTGFAITGTLPAFAATPTVNIGSAPTISVNNLATVSTAAPTYTNGSTAALSLTSSGALRVDTGGVGSTVTANIGTTNGLALNTTVDGLFKAGQSIGNTAFGISGTLPAFATTPTVNIGTAPTIAVTGNFYPATQPISATALPLPTGAATEAQLVTAVTRLTSIVTSLQGTLSTNSAVTSSALPTGAATAARQDTLATALGTPVQAGSTLSNVVQAVAIDRGAIVGTTAITLMVANASRRGFSFQNQSSTATCYLNSTATATADYHSLAVGPGGYFEPDHHVGTGAMSAICSAAATPTYAREW